jgi:hypothetical protein
MVYDFDWSYIQGFKNNVVGNGEVLMGNTLREQRDILKFFNNTVNYYSNEIINQSIAPFLNDTFAFSARIDLMTERTLWELKCTSETTPEHLIQVVIYAWIWRTLNPSSQHSIKLFNIKTGQILRLEAEYDTLMEIVVKLLKGKYEETEPIRDEAFLEQCI